MRGRLQRESLRGCRCGWGGRDGLTPVGGAAGYEVDFLVDDTTVVIECDGHERHGLDRDQFEFDRLRNAHLTAAHVLR